MLSSFHVVVRKLHRNSSVSRITFFLRFKCLEFFQHPINQKPNSKLSSLQLTELSCQKSDLMIFHRMYESPHEGGNVID